MSLPVANLANGLLGLSLPKLRFAFQLASGQLGLTHEYLLFDAWPCFCAPDLAALMLRAAKLSLALFLNDAK